MVLRKKGKARNFIKKIFPFLKTIKRKAKNVIEDVTAIPLTQDINAPLSLFFVMFANYISMAKSCNSLPVFIDIWDNRTLDLIVKKTENMKLFYVTSRDIFDFIKAKSPDSNVHYMPLSVSDEYYSTNFEKYRHKSIDVIQIGRQNPILHEYMLRYAEENKGIDYVYSSNGTNGNNWYISTLRGALPSVTERSNFINFLSSAKISLVSSPCIDGNKMLELQPKYPTPRFYESAILGCALLGRYPDNQEFRELNMSRYCPNITSYEQFVKELERALAQTPEQLFAQNREFIINSLTSKRAEQIQHDLEALTCTNS